MKNLEEKTTEFWWAAKLYRRKDDEASYQVLLTMESEVYLPPKLKNRVMEIKREHDSKAGPNPSGPVWRPSSA